MNRKNEKGLAFIEFTLILPLLLIVATGAFVLGQMFFIEISLTHAARAGAQHALISQTSDPNEVISETNADGVVDLPDIASAAVFVKKCSDGTDYMGTGTCSGYDSAPWNYVEVTTSYDFTTTPLAIVPLLPSTILLTKTILLRVS